MRRAGRIDPFAPVDLVVADDPADTLVEDLGATAGKGIHARVAKTLQSLADGDLRAPGEVRDLHHGERLQMDLGKALLEPAQHFAIPVERQLGMQPAYDVELGYRLRPTFSRLVPDLFQRHGVRLGIAHAFAEGAKAAACHANVGRVDVAVDIEVGTVAVEALAHDIGQIADAQDIVR